MAIFTTTATVLIKLISLSWYRHVQCNARWDSKKEVNIQDKSINILEKDRKKPWILHIHNIQKLSLLFTMLL